MSQYRESYANVPDGDFALMPPGIYQIKVIGADVHGSKSSGEPTWYLDLEVIGLKYPGKRLWFTVGMSDKAISFRKGTLTALGLDTSLDEKWDLIDDVLGRIALAEVYHQKGQDGVTREKVKRLRSAKATTSTDLPDDELPDFGGTPF